VNQNSFLRLFIRSLWFIFHRSSSLIAMVRLSPPLSWLRPTWVIYCQPCIAAVFSLVRAFLRKILPGCGCDSCCPCVSRFRASSRRGQASLVPIIPAALPPPRLHLGRVDVRFRGDRLRYLVSRIGSVGASAIDYRCTFSYEKGSL
jgi:hypothetical protein